jgi:hypothetical protein
LGEKGGFCKKYTLEFYEMLQFLPINALKCFKFVKIATWKSFGENTMGLHKILQIFPTKTISNASIFAINA